MKELPDGWVECKLEQIAADVTYGYTAKSSSEKVGPRMLRITDIQDKKVYWDHVPYCKISEANKNKYILKSGDLVFARTGATVGKSFLISGNIPDAVYASYLIRVRCLLNETIEYLNHFFNSPLYWDQITEFSSGIGQPNVNGSKLKSLVIPLAPIAEQKRITDKLDTLLARVEAARDHLDCMPAIFKQFRQAVLAAAISGKLTEEWRKGKAKNVKWKEVRIEDVTVKVGSGSTPRGGESAYKKVGIPLIRSMNVIFHGFKRKGMAYIDEEQALKLRNVEVYANDVLLNITGASIGRVTLAPSDMQGARVNQHVCIIRPSVELMAEYLCMFFSAPEMQGTINSENYGVTRQALTKQQILDFTIPLPSLDEQKEIDRRVGQMFNFVDKLEARYKSVRTKVDKLPPSLLEKAFRGELVEQDSNDEHAEKLLERIQAEREKVALVRKLKPGKKSPAKKEIGINMRPDSVISVKAALKNAGKTLSGQELLLQSGYPADANTETVEQFFLDIRSELKAGTIIKKRSNKDDQDWFSLA